MLRVMIVGLAFVVMQSAAAVNWTKYDQTRSFEAFIDADSVYSKDGIVRVWEKWEYAIPQKTDQGLVKTYLLSRAISCDDRRSAITAWVHRDSVGKAVNFGESGRNSWTFAEQVPGSVGSSLIDYVCKVAPVEKNTAQDGQGAEAPSAKGGMTPSDAIPPSVKNSLPTPNKITTPPTPKQIKQ
jgi:hypothetical protein